MTVTSSEWWADVEEGYWHETTDLQDLGAHLVERWPPKGARRHVRVSAVTAVRMVTRRCTRRTESLRTHRTVDSRRRAVVTDHAGRVPLSGRVRLGGRIRSF